MFRRMPSTEFVNAWMLVGEFKLRAEQEMNLKQQETILNLQAMMLKGYLDWSTQNVQ